MELTTPDNYLLRWPVRLSQTRAFNRAYLSLLEEISPFSWSNKALEPRHQPDCQTLASSFQSVDADAEKLRTWLLNPDDKLQPVSPVSVQTKAAFFEVQKRRLAKLKGGEQKGAMESYLRDLGCPLEEF